MTHKVKWVVKQIRVIRPVFMSHQGIFHHVPQLSQHHAYLHPPPQTPRWPAEPSVGPEHSLRSFLIQNPLLPHTTFTPKTLEEQNPHSNVIHVMIFSTILANIIFMLLISILCCRN